MGVTVKVTQAGDGINYPKKGDTVEMSYDGKLTNGTRFDQNNSFRTKIGVGQVIKGWDEGVPQMSLGEKATLTITPDYGYGAGGYPPVIPPNSTLVFDVQLKRIN